MKTVDLVKTFKKGDKVFDICYDWGTVERVTEDVMSIKFDNIKYMIPYTPVTALTLSFTKYTLQNFSQEKLINYDDYVGKWGKFYDEEDEEFYFFTIHRLLKYNKEEGRFVLMDGDRYAYSNYFKPLTEEQIKSLELE